MDNMKFNTPAGQTIARKLMILYGNCGTAEAPVWKPIGKRVEDSSMEMDWQEESKKDILGDTYATMKAPIVTQSFDPCELDSADEFQQKIWKLAIVDQDAAALCNQDLMVAHLYAGTADTAVFGERYHSCMVKPSALGGSATLGMPIDVTFGGTRDIGTVAVAAGGVTFTKEEAAAAAE